MSGCSRERIQEGRVKLYNKLAKHVIIDELHQRDVQFSSFDTKKNLEDKLITECMACKDYHFYSTVIKV